jgi:hypothetical protein
MRHLLASEQFRMEAQRARQNAQTAATKGDREFWQAKADKWERLAAYAEVHRKPPAPAQPVNNQWS